MQAIRIFQFWAKYNEIQQSLESDEEEKTYFQQHGGRDTMASPSN